MSVFGALGALLSSIADVLDPLFGASATGTAIIVFTMCVRLALHPLARAAVRGEKVRKELAPQLAELQRKHKGNPERLQKAAAELYSKAGTSPVAGCGPMVLQLPVFMVMYRLFSGHDDDLLGHTMLGAPLGDRWGDALADGGAFGAHGLVYVGLFAVIATVATWTFLRGRRLMATTAPAGPASMTKMLPLLSFGTLVTAALVPLAAGLYLATTTAWTAAERALLHRSGS